jgi:ABC-type sugar transport system substrate-binding protein
VETTGKLAKGEKVDAFVWIPFQLITRNNYKEFP